MKMDDEFERVCHGVNLILCSLLNISHRLSLSLTDSQWASIADIDSPLSDYHFQATSYAQRYHSFSFVWVWDLNKKAVLTPVQLGTQCVPIWVEFHMHKYKTNEVRSQVKTKVRCCYNI